MVEETVTHARNVWADYKAWDQDAFADRLKNFFHAFAAQAKNFDFEGMDMADGGKMSTLVDRTPKFMLFGFSRLWEQLSPEDWPAEMQELFDNIGDEDIFKADPLGDPPSIGLSATPMNRTEDYCARKDDNGRLSNFDPVRNLGWHNRFEFQADLVGGMKTFCHRHGE